MNHTEGLCSSCSHGVTLAPEGHVYKCRVLSTACSSVSHCSLYSGPDKSVDVAIVTAVDTEFDMVRQYLNPSGDWHEIFPEDELIEWYTTSFRRPDCDEASLKVVTAFPINKGMPEAAIQTTKAIDLFSPRYVLMPGITAGHPKDTNIGDIVVPVQVYDYGAGKWDDGQFRPEFKPERLERTIVSKCAKLRMKARGRFEELLRAWPGDRPEGNPRPSVHLGSAASGAAVINWEEIWERIRAFDRKVIALDMESYAVVLAANRASRNRPKAVIAKSVSDFGVGKDDSSRRYAAFASVCFMRTFLERLLLPDLPEVLSLRQKPA